MEKENIPEDMRKKIKSIVQRRWYFMFLFGMVWGLLLGVMVILLTHTRLF